MGNPIWRRGLDFAGHKDAAKSFRRESRDVAESRPIPTGGVVRVFQKEPCLRRSGFAAERQNGKRLAAIVVNSMAVSWGHVSPTEMHSSKVPEIFATLEFFREFRGVNLSPRSPSPHPPLSDSRRQSTAKMRTRINLWKDYYPALALRRWWRNTRHVRFPIDRTITTLCANILNTREQNKKIYRSEIIIKWYRNRTGRESNKSTRDSNLDTCSSCISRQRILRWPVLTRVMCSYRDKFHPQTVSKLAESVRVPPSLSYFSFPPLIPFISRSLELFYTRLRGRSIATTLSRRGGREAPRKSRRLKSTRHFHINSVVCVGSSRSRRSFLGKEVAPGSFTIDPAVVWSRECIPGVARKNATKIPFPAESLAATWQEEKRIRRYRVRKSSGKRISRFVGDPGKRNCWDAVSSILRKTIYSPLPEKEMLVFFLSNLFQQSVCFA